jgi:hypothetical protein
MGKKKYLLLVVIAVMMTTMFVGCGPTDVGEQTEPAGDGESLSFC